MNSEINEMLLEMYTRLKHSDILPFITIHNRDDVIRCICNHKYRSIFSVVLRDYTGECANLTLKKYISAGGVHIEQFNSAIKLIYIENVSIYGKPELRVVQRIIHLKEGEELDIRYSADF